jgi:hypothetical protein
VVLVGSLMSALFRLCLDLGQAGFRAGLCLGQADLGPGLVITLKHSQILLGRW